MTAQHKEGTVDEEFHDCMSEAEEACDDKGVSDNISNDDLDPPVSSQCINKMDRGEQLEQETSKVETRFTGQEDEETGVDACGAE